MNKFERFPKESICPICVTNDNTECALIPVDGTRDGSICEAIPIHTACIDLVFNKKMGIFYQKIDVHE